MIRVIVSVLFLMNITYAQSEHYFIKLGSFKNLQGLERSIAKLPSDLRSYVVIVRSNSWYIPFAHYSLRKSPLYSKVPAYKRYFPDAHINHSKDMMSHPVVRNYSSNKSTSRKVDYPAPVYVPIRRQALQEEYQNVAISEEDNTLNLPVRMPIIETVPSLAQPLPSATVAIESAEKVTQRKFKDFTKEMVSGKHYYLAYKSQKDSPNLLVKVSFGTHQVSYQPVIGDMKMTQANYLIEKSRLYMFTDSFTRDGAYSTLNEHRENHFLVSSWSGGKKLNTLRYYYHLNDAKKYLGIATSEGLASTLADGGFDDFFLNDSDD